MLQPINNARTLSGPEFQDLNARFQDLGFKPSVRAFRTWISGPGFQALAIWLSTPGFQALGIWLSGPGFQDLESSPSYGRLIFSLRHFSLRPVVTDGRTDGRTQQVTLYIRFTTSVCDGARRSGRPGPALPDSRISTDRARRGGCRAGSVTAVGGGI